MARMDTFSNIEQISIALCKIKMCSKECSDEGVV